MPRPQLTLPQQYGRYLVTGALVFILVFWGLSQFLISTQDVHLNFAAVRLIAQSSIHQPFPEWLQNLETAYLPFFLRQRPLLASYMIASVFGWLAGFFHDTKILRKENTL
jgi:uncharacterized protein involved in cysteine biosynthesis